jgi:membrane protein
MPVPGPSAITSPRERDVPVGRPPSSPRRLSLAEWKAALIRSFKEFMADDCMGLSQQVAYSSLLAFFPAVVLLVGLLGLFGAYDQLQQFLGTVAPKAVIDAIQIAQNSSHDKGGSVIAVLVGAVLAIWAASGAMNTIVKAINRAYNRQETRPFYRLRVISIILVLLTGLVTAGVFLLIVFGGPIGEAIAKRARLGGEFTFVWNIIRWPIAFVVILLFFALVYYLAPNMEHRSWKWVSPGSLLGGLIWLALSGLFALYTAFSSSYGKTYGSLAGAIVLLLWLNYSAFALLYGAELNAELDREADIHAAGGPNAGLTKPARRVSSS